MGDADCTPGREPRSVAASFHVFFSWVTVNLLQCLDARLMYCASSVNEALHQVPGITVFLYTCSRITPRIC